MTQQDYTAPQYSLRQSVKERYADIFQLVQVDGVTPNTSLKSAVVHADLYADKTQQKLTSGSCRWVSDHAVEVELSTAQLAQRARGRYRLEVYVIVDGEREDLVHVILDLQ